MSELKPSVLSYLTKTGVHRPKIPIAPYENVSDDSPLVKDAIIQVLQGVYPDPLKASEIRSKIEQKLSRTIHEKDGWYDLKLSF